MMTVQNKHEMTICWQVILTLLLIGKYEALGTCTDIGLEQVDASAYDKFQEGTLDIFTIFGPQQCIKECGYRFDCHGALYDKTNLTCVLLTTSTTSVDRTQICLGKCANNDCAELTKCIALSKGNYTCVKMGVKGGNFLISSEFPDYSRTIVWVAKPRCTGDEQKITDCDFVYPLGYAAASSRDYGVLCEDPNGPQNDSVRLVNGPEQHMGLLQINHIGVWGTISAYGWDDVDAQVVCRQLGYNNGVAVKSTFGKGDLYMPIWGSHIPCDGTENYLAECVDDWVINTYLSAHDVDVGVICSLQEINTTAEGVLRLVDVTGTSGRIEIYIHGIWGGICTAQWEYPAPVVVCRELGFGLGIPVYSTTSGSMNAIIDGFNCTGNEVRLRDCSKFHVYETGCNRNQHAGVMCLTDEFNSNDGTLRLQGGSNDTEGTLEVLYKGIWGTVYDYATEHWKGANPNVACRQLGFRSGRAVFRSFFAKTFSTVWMSDLRCEGHETKLSNCSFGGWGAQTLYKAIAYPSDLLYGIGLACSDLKNYPAHDGLYGDIRLEGGADKTEGRIEIYGPTGYGTIRSGWIINTPVYEVICRQLGLSYSATQSFGSGTGKVWIYYAECNGDEERLEYCKISGWGLYLATDHRYDAGVVCV